MVSTMDKIELLEERIKAAARSIQHLRESNAKVQQECGKLEQENELLLSENRQVRKLMSELDRLRDERKIVRQKCEKLLSRFQKMRI